MKLQFASSGSDTQHKISFRDRAVNYELRGAHKKKGPRLDRGPSWSRPQAGVSFDTREENA
jgi:hypothetical protein